MRDVETQLLLAEADDLRKNGKYKEAIRLYLDALKVAKKDWDEGTRDKLWQKKAIFMACNGMGIAYAKWGKLFDAIENFQDAIDYAPTDEARKVAERNLEKYKKVVKEKTGTNVHTF